MSNKELYDAAIEAIKKLWEDMSVDVQTTIENLETLKSEIDVLIESLGE